jgi:formylglycine-generating enzyme required for sulfatase activity
VPGAGDGFTDLPGLPELVLIPPGQCPAPTDAEPNDGYDGGAASLGQPLAVGRYPVTVDEFASFVHETGHPMPAAIWTYEGMLHRRWKERSGRSYQSPGFPQTGRHPVVGINWHDAHAYTRWLADKTGRHYRLLTLNEWWYIIGRWRVRTLSPKSAWSDADPIDGTAPVDTFQTGHWGTYAQSGRVWEWCADHWRRELPETPMSVARFHDGITSLRELRSGVLDISPHGLGRACKKWGSAACRVSICGLRVARAI